MARLRAMVSILTLSLVVSESFAQTGESDLKTFGYFQTSFQHWTAIESGSIQPGRSAFNSFSMQQLNIFFQKDLARHWRAFINFEVLNNFSSSRQWGSMNLEEAWMRYRYNEHFNLKFGLLIPIFNHLNEIKNRTPLLPYVIRPLVYESSFSEFISVEEFIPARAFVQAYGFLPSTEAKLDYALYLGNSPNININDKEHFFGPTGIDTTTTFLLGGRIGFRYKECKLGVSMTYDRTNLLQGLADLPEIGGPPSRFQEIPRIRLGGDGSYHRGKLSIEGECIIVRYDADAPGLSANKKFFYGTVGCRITDPWFLYSGYWFLEEKDVVPNPPNPLNPPAPGQFVTGIGSARVFTAGMAYHLNERITFKGQFGHVDFTQKAPSIQLVDRWDFTHLSVAASVFF